MNSKKSERDSNIELLRIAAACGVIILHYNNPNIGGAMKYIGDSASKAGWICLSESLSICAVNLFFLISGYFMWNRKSIDLFKPFNVLVRKSVFNYFSLVFCVLSLHTVYGKTDYMRALLPVDWFLITYCALIILSPFINTMLLSLGRKDLLRLIIVSVILFNLWPTMLDFEKFLFHSVSLNSFYTISNQGSQFGYTMINALIMYVIGTYFGRGSLCIERMKMVCFMLIGNTLLITMWAYVNLRHGHPDTVAWFYSNPLVILQAVLIFLLFRSLTIHQNRVINTLSKQSLTVYMLHKIFFHWLHIERYCGMGLTDLIIHELAGTVVTYLICWCIGWLYDIITGPLIHWLDLHWTRYRIIKIES